MLALRINQVHANIKYQVIYVKSHCFTFKHKQIICKAKYRLYKWRTFFLFFLVYWIWQIFSGGGSDSFPHFPWKTFSLRKSGLEHSLLIPPLDLISKHGESCCREKGFQLFKHLRCERYSRNVKKAAGLHILLHPPPPHSVKLCMHRAASWLVHSVKHQLFLLQ